MEMTANRTRAACAAIGAATVFFAGCSKPREKFDTIRPARVMTVRAAMGEDVALNTLPVAVPLVSMALAFKYWFSVQRNGIVARTLLIGVSLALRLAP